MTCTGKNRPIVNRHATSAPPARSTKGPRIEVAVVLLVTFGFSGLSAALALIQEAMARGGLAHQRVALEPSRSGVQIIDLAFQLLDALQLLAWAGLGLYLLWLTGVSVGSEAPPRRHREDRPDTAIDTHRGDGRYIFDAIGLARPRLHPDVTTGLALAALIGLPGLGLYVLAHQLGINVTVVPTTLHNHWWRVPMLLLDAVANAVAEEVVVVGYLLTRLREIGVRERQAMFASALLRGSYHLYQGLGGGLGNIVMGLVFARYWQIKSRLWPLIAAHTIIDATAYIGYTIVRSSTHWLP
jgi:membrane protease YdiL (CAAX protease family)